MSAKQVFKDGHARAIEAAWRAYLTGEHTFAKGDYAAFPIAMKQVQK